MCSLHTGFSSCRSAEVVVEEGVVAAVLIEVVEEEAGLVVVEVVALEGVEVAGLEVEEEVDEVDLTGSRTMVHQNMLSVRPIYYCLFHILASIQ